MGKKALSGRENWQTESGPGGLAGTAEKNLYKAFKKVSLSVFIHEIEMPLQMIGWIVRHI